MEPSHSTGKNIHSVRAKNGAATRKRNAALLSFAETTLSLVRAASAKPGDVEVDSRTGAQRPTIGAAASAFDRIADLAKSLGLCDGGAA